MKVNTPIAVLLEEGESADDIGRAAKQPRNRRTRQSPAQDEQGRESRRRGSGKGKSAEPSPNPTPPPPPRPRDDKGERIFASPLARRIAAEKGLDLRQIKGSGPHGRIVKADVEAAGPPEPPPEAARPRTRPLPDRRRPAGPSPTP